jgi:hypothetical protein
MLAMASTALGTMLADQLLPLSTLPGFEEIQLRVCALAAIGAAVTTKNIEALYQNVRDGKRKRWIS